MTFDLGFATAAVLEAVRPRHSGTTVNAHVVRPQREPKPDYAKMKEAIEGPQKAETSEENEKRK